LKSVFLRSLIITLIIHLSGVLPFGSYFAENFDFSRVQAQSPATPIYTVYRDAGWWENITTVAQALSWDTVISEDTEIQADVANTRFDLSVWGYYLVMYSVPVRSTGGANRSEITTWLQLNGVTNSEYGYATSYIRRAGNDFEWYNEWSAIIEAAPWDDLTVMIQQTDSHDATMERTPNRSGITILKLDDDWDYARLRPTAAQAVTTSWADVNLWTVDNLDAGGFSVSGNDITLSEWGKYLVTYNVGTISSGTDRTNNEMRLTLDGAEIDSTRSTAYIRNQQGNFTWISSYVGIIEAWANQVLNLELRRESSLQGTTNNTIPAKTGLTITKLPDSADYVRIWEIGGWQDISNTTTPLTFNDTIEQGIALTHDAVNTSEIDVNTSGSYLLLHSVYNARTGTSNAWRENPYLKWQLDGVDLWYGVSGSYNRHSNDGDGITNSSSSSAWVIVSASAASTLELVQQNEATNGESFYNAGRMWIQAVDLSTLFAGEWFLWQTSYRWRDDSSDFDDDAGWLAPENSVISNIMKNTTLRVRMKVQNTSWFVYESDSRFELQWAQTSDSCVSGLTWSSISTSWDAWEMVDTSHIAPNAESSATTLLTNVWWNTHIQSEWYHNSDGLTEITLANTFVDSSQKEYEFSINPTVYAQDNALYCFRLYDTQANDDLGINNFPKLQMWSTPTILADIWWEAGSIEAPANGWWTTLNFTWWPYTSPVIIGRTNTHNDPAEALVFEARSISSTWAEVRLCDSNAGNASGCQAHAAETIWYIVVDASQTSSIDGIEAGTFTADESFDTAAGSITTNYSETFSSTPYVFTSIQTTNGLSPIVTRVSATSLSGFTGWICRQNSQDDCDPSHGNETFWWIAVDPSVNPFFKDMDIGTDSTVSGWGASWNSWIWIDASFSTSFSSIPIGISQVVTNNWWQDAQIDEVQNVTLSWMQYRSCELDNDDDCDTHNTDIVRWMAIEEGVFANEYYLNETHYRWYENNGLITPATPLASENMVLNSLPASQEIRLRMLLQNSEINLPDSVLRLKLQYGAGLSCDSIPVWTDVWDSWGVEDWLHFDNPWVSDGATLPSSLLFWGGHNLQSYSESLPTVTNPSSIPVGQWGEWDFSLIKNPAATGDEYCFRVLTQNDDEIEYSSHAMINTSDTVAPVVSSYSPSDDFLFPIGNFELEYTFSDLGSGIDTSNYTLSLQRWNGTVFGADISSTYESLDVFTQTGAVFNISDLPYGRYQAGFEIHDNAGNNTFVIHEFYVDAVEFIISTPEVNIGIIYDASTQYTSWDNLTVEVKTVWAAFNVIMTQQTDMENDGEIIPDWDGTRWFGYEPSPFGSINAFGSWNSIWSETRDLHPDGEKYTYSYDLKYSVLLDIIENYSAGDYEALVDFGIQLDY